MQITKKPILYENMKVEHWFLTRFTITDAYQSLCKEFDALEYASNKLSITSNPPYVRIPIAINTSRTLKVNAHCIKHPDGRTFVACEGPNKQTVYDFWTLVWHENIKTVMSMNFPYEERCYSIICNENQETIQYWPVVEGETLTFMPYKITCISSHLMADCENRANTENECIYQLTQLRIHYCNPVNPQKDRIFTHVCYFRWPDGRIPLSWGRLKTSAEVSEMLLQILSKFATDNSLIHCHAGLGRTGVLIALDFAIHQLRNFRTVNVQALIETLRKQRPRMVMNRWQYVYINIVIAEEAYKLGLLNDRVNGSITRQLIDELWFKLEHDLNCNSRINL